MYRFANLTRYIDPRQAAEDLYRRLVWITATGQPTVINREAVLRAAGRTLLEFQQDVAAERGCESAQGTQ